MRASAVFWLIGLCLSVLSLSALGILFGAFGFRMGSTALYMGSFLLQVLACVAFVAAAGTAMFQWAWRQRFEWWLIPSCLGAALSLWMMATGLWALRG